MTEKEFTGWTWHTAENVVGQRDDALARLAQVIAADTANAAAADAKLADANNQIVLLTKQLAELDEKCRTMEGHPDVVAARKEAVLVKAKADKVQALALLAAAEKVLGE